MFLLCYYSFVITDYKYLKIPEFTSYDDFLKICVFLASENDVLWNREVVVPNKPFFYKYRRRFS